MSLPYNMYQYHTEVLKPRAFVSTLCASSANVSRKKLRALYVVTDERFIAIGIPKTGMNLNPSSAAVNTAMVVSSANAFLISSLVISFAARGDLRTSVRSLSGTPVLSGSLFSDGISRPNPTVYSVTTLTSRERSMQTESKGTGTAAPTADRKECKFIWT